MPLVSARTCLTCKCDPCGCNKTEICPELIESVCTPVVQEADCPCLYIPFGDKFEECKLPYPAGSLVSTECGLFYTPCKAYTTPAKKPWEKFRPDLFFRMYHVFILIGMGLNVRQIGCPTFCDGNESRPVFNEGDIGFFEGALWVSKSKHNVSLPPNEDWEGGKTAKEILSNLITS